MSKISKRRFNVPKTMRHFYYLNQKVVAFFVEFAPKVVALCVVMFTKVVALCVTFGYTMLNKTRI